jgi:glycosyltransferase involved in cell wall biosynthesis
MDNISAVIITKNEEANISECLKSISWVSEIILVDAESTDKTAELAKNFTSNIFIHKWEGFVKQKEFAVSQASNEWILNIDADERISPPLKEEIINLIDKDIDGYYLRRENYLLKKHIKSCGWDNDYQLRLVRKSKTRLTNRLVHEGFAVDGKTEPLKNRLVHYTFASIEKTISKINSYSSLRAEELYRKKKKIGGLTIITHGLAAFFRFFIVLKGYKDGVYGLIISLFNSITTFLVYMKVWELQTEAKKLIEEQK